jgi:hemerythrin-like domain-containing protein
MTISNAVRAIASKVTMSDKDVRSLLHKDHVEALDLAKRMHESTNVTERETLLSKLKPALTAHSRSEEKVVYNALISQNSEESQEYGQEGFVEHSLVDELLKRLAKGDASTEEWKAQAKVLYEQLHHHISEEETDVFASLGEHFESEQLEVMGEAFKAGKAAVLKAAKA